MHLPALHQYLAQALAHWYRLASVVLCASHQSRQEFVPPGGGLLFISASEGTVLCSDSAEAKIKIRMFRLFVIKAFLNAASVIFGCWLGTDERLG